MNPRNQPLDELVKRYTDNPGSAETRHLDFKAKEKIENTGGKRDIAKIAAAIANSGGGTIVVGVGEGDRQDIIQSFDTRSEIKRDLAHVFRDSTKPPLDQFTSISMERLSNGLRLLRIDIQPATKYPIQFSSPDMDGYVAYHRVEDTTRRMQTTDIVEFTKQNIASDQTGNFGIEASISLDSSELQIHEGSASRRTPNNRAILSVDRLGLIIPGRTYLKNPFKKPLTYHMETRATESGLQGLEDLLNQAEEELGADLGFDFGYGIKYGNKELIGRTAESYLEDLNDLENTLRLLDWEGESDPRPIAIGATRSDFGLVWSQIQYHTGSFTRVKCGLQLSDIPIRTEPLASVFGDTTFTQDNGLREFKVRLSGDEVPLSNPREELLAEDGRQARTEVIADNPYYNNADQMREATETTLPEPFVEALSTVDRLPYDVRGGYRSEDIYHTVAELELNYIDAIVPTYAVWPLCDPHEEAPSEDPPIPDWIPVGDEE